MKFSEAIREGSKLRPQAFYTVFSSDGNSCVFGAAYEAAGERMHAGMDSAVDPLKYWPWLKGVIAKCPVCGKKPSDRSDVRQIISMHLNDGHRWTRERIAEWIEGLEKKHDPTPAAKGTHFPAV